MFALYGSLLYSITASALFAPDPNITKDQQAPALIDQFESETRASHAILLTWVAVGDDGVIGTADHYDLRYSTQPITEQNFSQATQFNVAPPFSAGTPETVWVTGLQLQTTYYFAIKAIDEASNASPMSELRSASTLGLTPIFSDDVEHGQGIWFVEPVEPDPPHLMHISTRRAHSTTHAWYYGDETTGNYDTAGVRNFGGITTLNLIDLTNFKGTELSFWHYLQTENNPGYDTAKVLVRTPTTAWKEKFSSITTNGQWQNIKLDLSEFDGKKIQIAFSFDTRDGENNWYEGWSIDDIALSRAPTGIDQIPVALINGPYVGRTSRVISFSAAGSYDPDGTAVDAYRWDFGDGSEPYYGTTPAATHTYTKSGIYTAILSVTSSNLYSIPIKTTVSVTGVPRLNPDTGNRR
ncbi:MAG: choice-of-anchor J domain-containing protein [Candidatus Yanofskybacteria bacterium]|nr:choice-of-anchor J domain-containing protein [Candidatus Yanofskybacteria bacterium]